MGYACPVCGAPQADAEHLANHLAFTALLRGDDHEAWLDEHAPDWDHDDPEDLGDRITDHVEEVEYPQVFDDTTDEAATPVDLERHLAGAGGAGRGDPMDPETRAIVEEARELTEQLSDEDEAETE